MMIAHGNDKNEIYGFDGEPMKIRDLMDMMNAENCPKLRSKPRVFFFNCCRGGNNLLIYFLKLIFSM
jgi:caspase 2